MSKNNGQNRRFTREGNTGLVINKGVSGETCKIKNLTNQKQVVVTAGVQIVFRGYEEKEVEVKKVDADKVFLYYVEKNILKII